MSKHVDTPMGPMGRKSLWIGLAVLVGYVIFALLTAGWWV